MDKAALNFCQDVRMLRDIGKLSRGWRRIARNAMLSRLRDLEAELRLPVEEAVQARESLYEEEQKNKAESEEDEIDLCEEESSRSRVHVHRQIIQALGALAPLLEMGDMETAVSVIPFLYAHSVVYEEKNRYEPMDDSWEVDWVPITCYPIMESVVKVLIKVSDARMMVGSEKVTMGILHVLENKETMTDQELTCLAQMAELSHQRIVEALAKQGIWKTAVYEMLKKCMDQQAFIDALVTCRFIDKHYCNLQDVIKIVIQEGDMEALLDGFKRNQETVWSVRMQEVLMEVLVKEGDLQALACCFQCHPSKAVCQALMQANDPRIVEILSAHLSFVGTQVIVTLLSMLEEAVRQGRGTAAQLARLVFKCARALLNNWRGNVQFRIEDEDRKRLLEVDHKVYGGRADSHGLKAWGALCCGTEGDRYEAAREKFERVILGKGKSCGEHLRRVVDHHCARESFRIADELLDEIDYYIDKDKAFPVIRSGEMVYAFECLQSVFQTQKKASTPVDLLLESTDHALEAGPCPSRILELVRAQPLCEMDNCTAFAHLLWKRLAPHTEMRCTTRAEENLLEFSSGYAACTENCLGTLAELVQEPLPADLWAVVSHAIGHKIWYLGLHILSHACILETITTASGFVQGWIYSNWVDYTGFGKAGYTVGEWLAPADSLIRAEQNVTEILAARQRWGCGRLLSQQELYSFCSELGVLRQEMEDLRSSVLVPYVEGSEDERQQMLENGFTVDQMPSAKETATEWLWRETSGTDMNSAISNNPKKSSGERLYFQPFHPDLDVPHGHCVLFLGPEANDSAEQLLAWPLDGWREAMFRHARLFGEFPNYRTYILLLYLNRIEERWQYAVHDF